MAVETRELYKTCTLAASRLGYELKEAVENAKKEDFEKTVQGIVTLAQQVGVMKTCGLDLEKKDLVNAAVALYPMDWEAVQEELRAFGESAAEKIMG
ncbi:hypothetical protein ES708_19940 [subsurface metagenome]